MMLLLVLLLWSWFLVLPTDCCAAAPLAASTHCSQRQHTTHRTHSWNHKILADIVLCYTSV
jgi:hypothetical protein